MEVKMITTMAGPDGTVNAGRTVELPDAEAQALLDGGYAELVGNKPAAEDPAAAKDNTEAKPKAKPEAKRANKAPETAAQAAPETASTRKPGPVPVSGE